MNKKRFLKSILATSALAAVLMPAQSALGAAADRTTIAHATLSTGAGLNGATAFTTGSTLTYGGAHTLNIDSAVTIASIDVGGVAPGLITLNETATIGSMDLNGGTAIALTFGAAKTLTFSGAASAAPLHPIAANTYTGLGDIDFNNVDGTINIASTGATFGGTINSTGGVNGTLNVTGVDNKFTGVIGGAAAIDYINVTAATGTTNFVATTANKMKTGAGAVTIAGAAATFAGAGLAATDDAFATGAGLVTFSAGATNIGGTAGRLNIGAGGISTDQNLTIGAHGSTGKGKLTFTGGAQLALGGDYAAIGDIDTSGGNLVIAAQGDANRTISAPIKTTNNTRTVTFTGGGGGASSLVTLTENIGENDAAKTFANVTLTGANDRVLISSGKTIYSTAVTLTDAASELQFTGKSTVKGAIKSGADTGIITLKGTGSDAGTKDMTLDTATTGPLAEFKVDAAAVGSTLTLGTTDANIVHKINAFTFNQTTADDNSGLVVDLSNMTAGKTYGLQTALASTVPNAGGHGMIKFVNTGTGANAITLTMGGNIGNKTNHMNTIDATGQKLTLTGAFDLHVKNLYASELTFGAGADIGLYGAPDAVATVGKFIVAANGGFLEGTDSNLKEGTEFHFTTDNTVALGKGVNFNGSLTIDAASAGKGKLTLAEGNTVVLTAAGLADRSLTSISFAGAAGTSSSVEGTGDMYVAALDFNNPAAGTIALKGNLIGAVTTQNAGTGTLELLGGKVTKSVGAAVNGLNTVKLNTTGTVVVGEDSGAASTFKAGTVNFAQNGTLEIHKNVQAAALTLAAVTTDTANTGNIVFNQNVTTTNNVGTSAKPLASFTVQEDSLLTVAAGNELNVQNVKTNVNNKSKVTFTNASASTGTTIGSSALRFAQVTNTAGNADLAAIYATDLAITAGKLTAKTFDVTNAVTGAGTAEVRDGGSIGATGGTVAVTTLGSATLNGNIAGTLNTSAVVGKVVTLNAATVTGAATFGASTLVLPKNVAFADDVTFASGAINTGSSVMSLATGKTLALNGPATSITLSGSVTPIVADIVSTDVATNVINIEIDSLVDSGFAFAKKVDGSASILQAAGANATAANFKFVNNEFYKEGATYANGLLTATVETDVTKVASAQQLANEHSREFITGIVKNTGSADTALKAWVSEYRKLSRADKDTLVEQTSDKTVHAAKANVNALHMASNTAANRVSTFAGNQVGVAAGDAADKYGIWAKGTFGTATQKLRKGESGYKSNAYGAYVGVDTMLNDRTSVGLMVGYSNDRLKLKDAKAGGKTKANSWMFGAYGSYDFDNNFFAQGSAALAQTAVKNRELRLTQTATGKYDVMGYTAEVRGGYKFRFDNSLLTPTAGLRFNYMGDTSYTETGAGVHNQKVTGKATTGIDAVAGVSLSTALDVDGMVVLPEVHMNVDYALTNQAAKIDYNLNGSNVKFNYKGSKPAKFGYNFGASVMTQADNVEYGVGYDARIADKYLGHQGSVKVKLSF